MTKQTQMLLMLGLGGAVAWLGYRNYQMKKTAEEASRAAQDAASLSANGQKDLATLAAQQAAEIGSIPTAAARMAAQRRAATDAAVQEQMARGY